MWWLSTIYENGQAHLSNLCQFLNWLFDILMTYYLTHFIQIKQVLGVRCNFPWYCLLFLFSCFSPLKKSFSPFILKPEIEYHCWRAVWSLDPLLLQAQAIYLYTAMDISCLPRAYLPSSRGLTGSLHVILSAVTFGSKSVGSSLSTFVLWFARFCVVLKQEPNNQNVNFCH